MAAWEDQGEREDREAQGGRETRDWGTEISVLTRSDQDEVDELVRELETTLPDREEREVGELDTSRLPQARTAMWRARGKKPLLWQAQLSEEILLPPPLGAPRIICVNAGRGVGKTTFGPELAWEGATVVWNDDLGPPHVKVFADTYDHGQKIWSQVLEEGMSILQFLVHSMDGERNIINLRSESQPSERGASLQLLSADNPRAMAGHNDMTLAIVDESQFVKNESWKQFFPCMNIRKAVLVAFGVCQGLGTYRTMSLKGLYQFDYPEYRTIRVPSTRNPYFTRELDELARRDNTTEDYLNLYQAKWREAEGELFENIHGCVIDPGVQVRLKNGVPLVFSKPRVGGDYVAGLDIARARDYMACLILERETGRVVAALRVNKRTYVFQEELVARFLLAYRPLVYVDVTGMGRSSYEHIVGYVRNYELTAREAERPRTRFVPVEIQKDSKSELIDGLALKLKQERVRFPHILELVSELEVFEMRVSLTGSVQYGAPTGMHDDLVITLALAASGLRPVRMREREGSKVVRVGRGWETMAISSRGW